MAIAFVQTGALGSAGTATSQQTSIFGTNPTVGNYLVAWAWGWSSSHQATPAFSDTGSNSWTVPTNAYQQIAADLWCIAGYTKVATSGSSFRITITTTGWTSGAIMVVASEFSGVASASPLDGSAVGTTGTTGAPAPGSLSFTSGDLLVAVMANDGSGNPTTVTTPSGWTSVGKQTNGASFEVGDAIYQIAPASPVNPTWNSSTVKWSASQFALKSATTGATVSPASMLFHL